MAKFVGDKLVNRSEKLDYDLRYSVRYCLLVQECPDRYLCGMYYLYYNGEFIGPKVSPRCSDLCSIHISFVDNDGILL